MSPSELAALAARTAGRANARAIFKEIVELNFSDPDAAARKASSLTSALDELEAVAAEASRKAQAEAASDAAFAERRTAENAEAARKIAQAESDAAEAARKARAAAMLKMTWAGEWRPAERYLVGSVVSRDGVLYIAVAETSEPPKMFGPGWERMTAPPGGGAPGSSGPPGPPGPPGTIGDIDGGDA